MTKETINGLNSDAEFSLKEKEMLVSLIEKEITVTQWCRSSREIQKLTDLKEKIKMLIK